MCEDKLYRAKVLFYFCNII